MGNLINIKEDIENLKDTFSLDIEKELDKSLEYFDSGNYYKFKDILNNILINFRTSLGSDYSIISNWYTFSNNLLNNGFIHKFNGDFVEFSELERQGVVNILGNTFISYDEAKQDLLNGDIYFPKKVTALKLGALRNTCYIRCIYLHEDIDDIGGDLLENSNIEEFYSFSKINYVPSGMFKKCFSLEKVYFENKIDEIGDCAFFECNELKEVVLGKNIRNIGKQAFYKCYELEKFDFGENIRRISDSSFEGDYLLKDINFPETLSFVGESAFAGCTNAEVSIPCTCSFLTKSFDKVKEFTPYVPKKYALTSSPKVCKKICYY